VRLCIAELGPVESDHQQCRVLAGGLHRRAHPLHGHTVDDHHRCAGVVDVVGVVLRLQERVHLGGHRADLLRRVPGRDEFDRVGEREEHAVLRTHPKLEERVADLVGQRGELGIRAHPGAVDERRPVAASFTEIAVEEVRGDIEGRRFWLGSH